jgi:ABC-type Co2+ transport system permease subunit
MIISFDKFWDFLKNWNAGRLAVFILLVGEILLKLKGKSFLAPDLLFKLISMAILLEIFETTMSKFKPESKKSLLFLIASIASICGIILIAISAVFSFGGSGA